jgi:hypothetical protein
MVASQLGFTRPQPETQCDGHVVYSAVIHGCLTSRGCTSRLHYAHLHLSACHWATEAEKGRTLLARLTAAPAARSLLTTWRCPLLAATFSGVQPFCSSMAHRVKGSTAFYHGTCGTRPAGSVAPQLIKKHADGVISARWYKHRFVSGSSRYSNSSHMKQSLLQI